MRAVFAMCIVRKAEKAYDEYFWMRETVDIVSEEVTSANWCDPAMPEHIR